MCKRRLWGGFLKNNRAWMKVSVAVLGAMAATVIGGVSGPHARADDLADRGAYLAGIMDCGGCHTTGALAGAPDPNRLLGGSDIGFEIPGLGIFYPPNLTPDMETGIGGWSVDDIMLAVREGTRPDGRELAPIMPWRSYGVLTDDDARALATYLRSLTPVSHQAPGPVGSGQTPTSPYMTVLMPE